MHSHRFTLTVLRHRFLGGPNVWTYRSAMEVWLDLGELEERPSNTIEGLTDRLLAMLPGLEAHHCGVGEHGGFLQRLREGTWPAMCWSTASSSCSTDHRLPIERLRLQGTQG